MAWGRPTEPWFATGVAVALGGLGAVAVQWQTAKTATPSGPFWGWLSYLGVALIFLGAVCALANAGIPLQAVATRLTAFVPRRPRVKPTQEHLPSESSVGRWLTLHPLVVDGQLRATLRHSSGSNMSVWHCEAEIDGPDGAFTNSVRSRDSGFFDGVYVVNYPRNFAAKALRPGTYAIRWFARNYTNQVKDDGLELSHRILIAESVVSVTEGWRVERP